MLKGINQAKPAQPTEPAPPDDAAGEPHPETESSPFSFADGTAEATCQRVYERASAILALAKDCLPPLRFSPSAKGPAEVPELALILCHHGHDPARVSAGFAALGITLQSTPAPARMILVEAAREGDKRYFDHVPGVDYLAVTVTEQSKDIWLKEALWSKAAREALASDAAITKLVFLDIDCSYVDPSWLAYTSCALDRAEVVSPHAWMYYSGQPDGIRFALRESAGYALAKGSTYGFPGMAIAMTRDFFLNRLEGRLPNLSTGGGDSYLWLQLAGNKRFALDRFTFSHSLTRQQVAGLQPRPVTGHAGQIVVHHPHGPLDNRCYRQRNILARACASALGEELCYLPDGLPAWTDTPGGRILPRARKKILEEAARGEVITPAYARDVYDALALEEYGPIDEANPLVVTCLLRSGGIYSPAHVHWLKGQFERFCLAPFRFVCQADVAIPDVETIPLATTPVETAGTWAQVEHYRDLWGPDASVLTCDLDTVLFRAFTPHRSPKDSLFMLREVNGWYRSGWAIWGGGLTFFRGDYSFIFEEYRAALAKGGQHHPGYQCIGPQEFVTSVLRSHGCVPRDIEAHFCPRYYQGRPDSVCPEAHFAVFPDTPKPWDIRPRPGWIPELD